MKRELKVRWHERRLAAVRGHPYQWKENWKYSLSKSPRYLRITACINEKRIESVRGAHGKTYKGFLWYQWKENESLFHETRYHLPTSAFVSMKRELKVCPRLSCIWGSRRNQVSMKRELKAVGVGVRRDNIIALDAVSMKRELKVQRVALSLDWHLQRGINEKRIERSKSSTCGISNLRKKYQWKENWKGLDAHPPTPHHRQAVGLNEKRIESYAGGGLLSAPRPSRGINEKRIDKSSY